MASRFRSVTRIGSMIFLGRSGNSRQGVLGLAAPMSRSSSSSGFVAAAAFPRGAYSCAGAPEHSPSPDHTSHSQSDDKGKSVSSPGRSSTTSPRTLGHSARASAAGVSVGRSRCQRSHRGAWGWQPDSADQAARAGRVAGDLALPRGWPGVGWTLPHRGLRQLRNGRDPSTAGVPALPLSSTQEGAPDHKRHSWPRY